MPSTMLHQIRGVQRRLTEIGFLENVVASPIFNDPNKGLSAVLDINFDLQQSKGSISESHSLLTIDDIRMMFSSEYINPDNANILLDFVFKEDQLSSANLMLNRSNMRKSKGMALSSIILDLARQEVNQKIGEEVLMLFVAYIVWLLFLIWISLTAR